MKYDADYLGNQLKILEEFKATYSKEEFSFIIKGIKKDILLNLKKNGGSK